MRKDALKVDHEYALWTGSGSYESAANSRWGGRLRYLDGVARIKVVALDKRADVKAGPHTATTVSLPVITIQRLKSDGSPDGKPTWLRDGRQILSSYDEWLKATKLARAQRVRETAASDQRKAAERAILDDIADRLNLNAKQRKNMYARSYRDGDEYSVTLTGLKPPRRIAKKRAA